MYTVVCTNIGGLANRMRCIASIHKYSVDKPLECRVKWEVLDDYKKHTHILNCPFSKLFSNDIELKKTPEKKYYLYRSHCLLVEDKDGIPDGFNTFESKCAKQFTKSDKRGRNIDFMYHKIPNELRERYINAFNILEPIPELQTKIQEFSDSHFESDTVSVHIRSWNRNGETGRRGYLYSIEKFEVEMRKRESHVKFFIATDSQYVRDFFNSSIEWKERVIFFMIEKLIWIQAVIFHKVYKKI